MSHQLKQKDCIIIESQKELQKKELEIEIIKKQGNSSTNGKGVGSTRAVWNHQSN